MAEHQTFVQAPNPREIGPMNFIGLLTLIRKEIGRFMNVYVQTILAPIITTLLFYTIFAVAFGGDGRMIGTVPYMAFLIPGLVMMSMIQNSFANTSSSLMISKVQGNIVDILMPPLSPFEILVGYIAAGVIRGLVVGIASMSVVLVMMPVWPESIGIMIVFTLLGTIFMSTLGLMAGLWSDKFDQLAAITNFIVIPLTFLSGTFYSINSLPPVWQAIAGMNPFFYMIDGFRYGVTGHAESNIWSGIGMLCLYNFSMMIFAYAMILTGYKTKN